MKKDAAFSHTFHGIPQDTITFVISTSNTQLTTTTPSHL
jgi:hypothetical protein